jgi:hypothetical protein
VKSMPFQMQERDQTWVPWGSPGMRLSTIVAFGSVHRRPPGGPFLDFPARKKRPKQLFFLHHIIQFLLRESCCQSFCRYASGTWSVLPNVGVSLLLVILGVVVALFILAFVRICLYRRKKDPGESSAIAIGTPSSAPAPASGAPRKTLVPRNLIPPLLFTEQMTDPRLQEDLRETLGLGPANVTYV